MADDPFDTPGTRTGADDATASRRLLWLALGIALGVVGALLVPRYVGPYLPGLFGSTHVRVEGQVLRKARGEDRLLLTLESDSGAMLATFREKVEELDLLIGEGDIVTLAVTEYRPFVERPVLVGVRKGRWPVGGAAGADTVGTAADTASGRPDAPR